MSRKQIPENKSSQNQGRNTIWSDSGYFQVLRTSKYAKPAILQAVTYIRLSK